MSPPLRPFRPSGDGGVELPCSDCGAPLLTADSMHVLIEPGADLDAAPVVCRSCASCVRCRAIPEDRYPTADGATCAGCLTMAEQVAAGLRDR